MKILKTTCRYRPVEAEPQEKIKVNNTPAGHSPITVADLITSLRDEIIALEAEVAQLRSNIIENDHVCNYCTDQMKCMGDKPSNFPKCFNGRKLAVLCEDRERK